VTTTLTRMVARGLLAPILVVAAAILVKGYADVGDGFAAGVVAALGVLLQILAFGREEVAAALPLRHAPMVALAGVGVSLVVVAVPVLLGDAPLEHRPGPGGEVTYVGSLELISPVLFDVGVALLVLGGAVAIIDALITPDDEQAER
jgi:multisubunit Na+/H+ antiporter MnhB subunit